MKDKGEDVEFYESIKTEDFESYENIKARTLSPMKHADRY